MVEEIFRCFTEVKVLKPQCENTLQQSCTENENSKVQYFPLKLIRKRQTPWNLDFNTLLVNVFSYIPPLLNDPANQPSISAYTSFNHFYYSYYGCCISMNLDFNRRNFPETLIAVCLCCRVSIIPVNRWCGVMLRWVISVENPKIEFVKMSGFGHCVNQRAWALL